MRGDIYLTISLQYTVKWMIEAVINFRVKYNLNSFANYNIQCLFDPLKQIFGVQSSTSLCVNKSNVIQLSKSRNVVYPVTLMLMWCGIAQASSSIIKYAAYKQHLPLKLVVLPYHTTIQPSTKASTGAFTIDMA